MKDYYATLGVTPQAEDVVIKAAYRALAQRYHPDRFSGSADEATRKMADINEAYAVLSDSIKKKAYDEEYQQFGGGAADFDAGDAAADEGVKQVYQDWEVALEYYPDLANLEASLAKTSKSLAFTFRLYIIVEKAYKQRKEIAEALHDAYLINYFGSNPSILPFCKGFDSARQEGCGKGFKSGGACIGGWFGLGTGYF